MKTMLAAVLVSCLACPGVFAQKQAEPTNPLGKAVEDTQKAKQGQLPSDEVCPHYFTGPRAEAAGKQLKDLIGGFLKLWKEDPNHPKTREQFDVVAPQLFPRNLAKVRQSCFPESAQTAGAGQGQKGHEQDLAQAQQRVSRFGDPFRGTEDLPDDFQPGKGAAMADFRNTVRKAEKIAFSLPPAKKPVVEPPPSFRSPPPPSEDGDKIRSVSTMVAYAGLGLVAIGTGLAVASVAGVVAVPAGICYALIASGAVSAGVAYFSGKLYGGSVDAIHQVTGKLSPPKKP